MSYPIIIYTDGSSLGNPGRGGYGIVMKYGVYRKEFLQGFQNTTNNRMELMAIIVALENISKKDIAVEIYSDSKYVIDSVTKGWVFGWQKKGFAGKKNADLWKRFLLVYPKHKITFHWVKGHSNNVENERCDVLAVSAASGKVLLVDVGYLGN